MEASWVWKYVIAAIVTLFTAGFLNKGMWLLAAAYTVCQNQNDGYRQIFDTTPGIIEAGFIWWLLLFAIAMVGTRNTRSVFIKLRGVFLISAVLWTVLIPAAYYYIEGMPWVVSENLTDGSTMHWGVILISLALAAVSFSLAKKYKLQDRQPEVFYPRSKKDVPEEDSAPGPEQRSPGAQHSDDTEPYRD